MSLTKELQDELISARNSLSEALLKDPHAGMKVFADGHHADAQKELTGLDATSRCFKREDGSLNEQEVLRRTVYECFHCGSRWRDVPEVRRQLDESAFYMASNPTALPENIGFSWPSWAGQRLAWGGEQNMLGYLRAKAVSERLGNNESLKQWYQKSAARAWDDKMTMVRTLAVATVSNIDPKLKIPNELFRSMEVDCQKDKQLSAIKGEDMTGHFWVTAFATDKAGNDVQLWRGYCQSWDEWISKYKELGIPTKNVSVDASFKPDEVKAMAARHAEIVTENGQKIYATWTTMRGSDQHSFRWDDGIAREYRIEKPEQVTLYADGGKTAKTINVNVITWSNFRLKNLLQAILTGTTVSSRMTVLAAGSPALSERTRAMESGDCTWDNQMNSEILGETAIGHKPKWVPIHKENHYRDDVCMHIVRKLQAGIGAEAVESVAQAAS